MIRYVKGDIFTSEAQVLVNPVNCEGVMGKGLALQFKRYYPFNFDIYKEACETGYLRPGTILPVKLGLDRCIVNFPTKDKWRRPSRIEYITMGMAALYNYTEENDIMYMAMPTLGCGLGGLHWPTVRDLIEHYFKYSSVYVDVYDNSAFPI